MGQDEFQRQVIDRLARIETKQDATHETIVCHAVAIAAHSVDIAKVDASAKSAHKRIDGIYAAAGVIGAATGGLINFLTSLWPKNGGH